MTHSPSDVARQLQTSVSTIQRWSSQFAAHLSPQATPEPGQRRTYVEADITTFRRAQRMLQTGMTWQQVNSQLAVIAPDEEPEEAPPAGPTEEPEEAHERQSSQAGQALMVLTQQQRIIDGQASQLADQAARLREQAAQVASQAAELAALRERLARVEEAQRQNERRRFRWPWEARPEG